MSESGPIFLPKGFSFSAMAAGIKASGKPDLALIMAAPGTTAAALFTKNLVAAAPVEVGRASLKASRGQLRAVVVNSGNANCATGAGGLRSCKLVCDQAAKLMNVSAVQVFPSSTGIIGVPLPAEKITARMAGLVESAEASVDGLRRFANAILTTDTRLKIASVPLLGGKAAITGAAKGAGMIHPQLATMLVYLMTDVQATAAELRASLKEACEDSFNAISIDGDTSTNDTVLLLASAGSGITLGKVRGQFDAALRTVCRALAEQIVADGEGVQHVIRLRIEQARNRNEALAVARTIAHSLLVKTAWAGADPNWGRILAAVGRSGVPVESGKISVTIGDQTVCRKGAACEYDGHRAHEELSKPESRVAVRLGMGKCQLDFMTTDLTQEYVRINADYST